MNKSVAFTLLMISTLPLIAADAVPARPKPAWEWTLEERVAKRYDPASLRDRMTREATEPFGIMSVPQGTIANPSPTATRYPSIIIGARDPELFMPWELFDDVVRNAYGDDSAERVEIRAQIEQRAKEANFSLPGGFWEELGRTAKPWIDFGDRVERAGRRLRVANPIETRELRREIDKAADEACTIRFNAFNAVREHFGADWIAQFLYQVVAPDVRLIRAGGADDPVQMLSFEGGCR
ncbi:MAG: hypothetical protein QOI24_636 [Acidobacteriota bacterium]|jgi:hypothetical protein|nr:hypothetical protein [Acidobacteriota bacterium]